MRLLLPMLIGGSLLIGLSAFTFYQKGTIEVQREKLVDSAKRISHLSESLEFESKTNEILVDDKIDLEDKVEELRDSIRVLKHEIFRLRKKIRGQSDEITSLQYKLKLAKTEYNKLKAEIAGMLQNGSTDKEKITALESQKASLRAQIESMEQERIVIALAKRKSEDEIVKNEENMLEAQLSKEKFQRLSDILNNTAIRFESVDFRKKRYSSNMKRLKRKSWKYTVLNFFMEHQNIQLLIDEKFVMKIIDMDSNEILSYVEHNPNFPDDKLKIDGLQYRFDGNMVEIVHFNNETKTGKNYEVQLYHIDEDGEETMLLNGAKQIVANGKPVKS